MERIEYSKNYYETKYKTILQNKKKYCDCCKEFIVAWSIYKHDNSKKHLFNMLSEDDKQKYLQEKENQKIEKKINKLKSKLVENL
jgi:hypothetical protein